MEVQSLVCTVEENIENLREVSWCLVEIQNEHHQNTRQNALSE
jgi:hypothetical protein